MHESTTTERAVRSLQALGLSRTTARSFTAFALCLQWNDESNQPDAQPIPLDEVFDALSERRRRYVLYCLYQHENPVAVSTLARWIITLETDASPETVAVDDVERVETDLHHAQIPRLATERLVDYDRDDDVVSIADDGPKIQPYLVIAAQDDLGDWGVPVP